MKHTLIIRGGKFYQIRILSISMQSSILFIVPIFNESLINYCLDLFTQVSVSAHRLITYPTSLRP